MAEIHSDTIETAGALAQRSEWKDGGWCPIERTIDLVGTRSAMILIREFFFGARRFDDLVRRTGLTEAMASRRLAQMVSDGLLERRPYQEPGQRTRNEYVLTDLGRHLFPVVAALIQFGNSLAEDRGQGIELTHDQCGAPIEPAVHCAEGHDVPLEETVARLAGR
jgi:DNA-binding HxlR family transcriptional regulator